MRQDSPLRAPWGLQRRLHFIVQQLLLSYSAS